MGSEHSQQAITGPRFRLLSWFLAVSAALLLMMAAFFHAAASIGLQLPWGQWFGSSFTVQGIDTRRLEQRLARRPDAETAAQLREAATAILKAEPLERSAWRAVGFADRIAGEAQRSENVLTAAHQLSRRDSAVQALLIDVVVGRRDVAATLRHFDALMRTEPEAREALLPRLTAVLGDAEARRDLRQFVRSDNPWFRDFMVVAVPRVRAIAPLATMLADVRTLPDDANLRAHYADVVTRLVNEREFALLRRLYPKLPGARSQDMASFDIGQAIDALYPPVGWMTVTEVDFGAEIIDSSFPGGGGAIEILADPLSRGVVARRLLLTDGQPVRASWTMVDRSGNRDATLMLRLRCLSAEGATDSANLMAGPARGTMMGPEGCLAVMAEFIAEGGAGRDPANALVDRLSLVSGPSARRATR